MNARTLTDQERREKNIEFEMNYCQHYGRGKGADMVCAKGVDLKTFQKVQTGDKQIKWGPCIEGHMLANALSYCPHWIRRTREMGEKRADAIQRSMDLMLKVMPVVDQWRKKKPIGKVEIIQCPACNGRLHLSQASYNGHVHARCETENCVSWME